jgi:hypothetical protein
LLNPSAPEKFDSDDEQYPLQPIRLQSFLPDDTECSIKVPEESQRRSDFFDIRLATGCRTGFLPTTFQAEGQVALGLGTRP